MDLLVLALRIGLALAFLVAAVAKLRKPQATVQALAVLPLPDRLRISAAYSLPIIEIVLAITLLVPFTSELATLATGVLLAMFTIFLLITLLRRVDVHAVVMKPLRETVACARRPGKRGVSRRVDNRHYRPTSTKPV